jgi:hypothetical protein
MDIYLRVFSSVYIYCLLVPTLSLVLQLLSQHIKMKN